MEQDNQCIDWNDTLSKFKGDQSKMKAQLKTFSTDLFKELEPLFQKILMMDFIGISSEVGYLTGYLSYFVSVKPFQEKLNKLTKLDPNQDVGEFGLICLDLIKEAKNIKLQCSEYLNEEASTEDFDSMYNRINQMYNTKQPISDDQLVNKNKTPEEYEKEIQQWKEKCLALEQDLVSWKTKSMELSAQNDYLKKLLEQAQTNSKISEYIAPLNSGISL